MTPQERVITSARRWIGTPYRHQGHCRGAGTDCLGLVRGVWRELFGSEPEVVPAYSRDWSEPQGEERLWQAAGRHLIEREISQNEFVLGDVVLFRMKNTGVAKHLGIISSLGTEPAFIHAYSRYGVVESPLSRPWRRRIVARFQFPVEKL